MGRYRFKNDRKHKMNRITIILVLLIIIFMIMFFILRDVAGENNYIWPPATAGTTSPSLSEATSPFLPEATSPSSPEATTSTSAPTPDFVSTTDHGILPITGSVEESGKMSSFKTKVENYIFGLDGKYGVSFIDLATGEYFGINDRDSYIAASTSKIFMNVMLYTKFESGEINPDAPLIYLEEDFEPGAGIIKNEPYGTEYTVREASRLSIIHSDNCAINMIIRILGIEEICQYVLDLGGDIYYDDGHLTSPYDLTLVAKEFYRLYLNNPELYGELIYYLENTEWDDRISGRIPKEVMVAHKIGDQVRVANDVGIVFASHPFALAVLTDDVEEEKAKANIAILSKMIYDEVEAYVQ